MKKILRFIFIVGIFIIIIIGGILIFLNRKDTPKRADRSSSIWLTREKESVIPLYVQNTDSLLSYDSIVVANNNAVNASSWYESAYITSSLSGSSSIALSKNFYNLNVPEPVKVIRYFNIFLLNYSSSDTIPKTYIVSVPSDNITDSIKSLDAKIKALRKELNQYGTWTYGADKLSNELAGYNLQKYAYPDYNKINSLLYKINVYRSNNSLDILTTDSRLQLYAMERAIELAWIYDNTGSYSSLSPDGSAPDKLMDKGYSFYGENIAYNSFSASDIFNKWTNLDYARRNLLCDKYRNTGIGLAQSSDSTWFWVILYSDR